MTATLPSSVHGSILGNRVMRTEDPALLTGSARYVADLDLDRPLHAVFVRSDIAHGTINSIDVDEARQMPGVVDVWTAAELDVSPHHGFAKIHDDFARPPLATERVRFVGEAVAVVFAESAREGVDAAQAVWADIEPLPAVTDPELALADGAPVVFPDHGDNIATTESPDEPVDIDAVSDVVVRGRYVNQRIAVAPMEPHGFAVAPADDGRLTVYPSNQFPHYVRMFLAGATGIGAERLHVVTPQVGGGFGGKAGLQHEYTVVAVAADRLGRPVVWIPTRTEDMQAKDHSRAQVQYAELGCRADGTFTGLRVHLVGNGGAYPGIGAALPGGTRRMSHGTYDFPAIDFDVAVAVTNTPPTGAYRGAGRPEATALLERLVDQAARELSIDPIELRERNLLGDDVFPFTSHTGNVYDSGRYLLPLRTAADAIGYDELRAEQAARRESGDVRQLGIGVACYVEITAGGLGSEFGRVDVHADGSATIYAGTLSHGQGHQTTYAMLVSARTGIPVDRISLVDGDTDRVREGSGTGGSRSLQVGGSAVDQATEVLVDRAKALAADVLEADAADIVVDVDAGTIGVTGVPASALTWAELAARAESDGEPLTADTVFEQDGATFPFGAHIAVVEVDTETGEARLIRHVAVDDCGTVVNKLLVEGQQHGGVASGVGQALYEEVRYDGHGNPITSNFADYGLPSAAEMPSFEVHSTETPSPLNPLGAKGIGEAATIGSTPAIQNAVIDAVSHLGVRHIDMPCSAERVWRAIEAARHGNGDPWREPPAVFASMTKGVVGDEAAAEAADGI
ncbi:MAG: xanthine dehydrogenase family protein molybdopterin-binding subunit [Ilumatobacter sp.]|uniref:xanthine dehydrogenase family protein molybdopterin-binding subunit n=1 Tax=Ilumatobacter sp. TaxID=1967498 RepID=UPI0026119F40|nr:xanthine dehydrogenase family protein molybdopterin-binding subunit [Ilumatobacter sp.]MDJ0767975.1 xanthine dehydrogenase family protein molybdopterin-binding subunit [Ilumatobacter sp.]